MLRDRGNKKWIAMMLPEHVAKIRGWLESANDIPEPEHDEFSLNALADDLNIAYKANSTVQIYYWNNKRVEVHQGQIVELLANDYAIKFRADIYNAKLYLQHIIKVDIFE